MSSRPAWTTQQDTMLKEKQSSILQICVQSLSPLLSPVAVTGVQLSVLCIVALRAAAVAALTFLSWLC